MIDLSDEVKGARAIEIGSSDIEFERLPRTLVGGLKPEAVHELLRRLEWDYAQLQYELKRHEKTEDAEPSQSAPVAMPHPRREAPRQTPEELALMLLDAAARTARELRESTRHECELMLRKTRSRAGRLERELERTIAARNLELAELEATVRDLRAQMISALEVLGPAADESGALHQLFPVRSKAAAPAPLAGTQR
jgi:hypothetical protein